MRKFKLFFLFCSFIALLQGVLSAGTYPLVDGQQITGDPISYDQKGVLFKSDGQIMERTPWAKFTQDALKQLREDAKTPKDKALVDPLIEEDVQEKAKAKEIIIKPVPHVERPTGATGFFTLFSSPLGFFILLMVYAAIIYAGYEVARFKGHSIGLVCGLSAIPFLGFFAPIIFLVVDPQRQAVHAGRFMDRVEEANPHEAENYVPTEAAPTEEAAPESAAAMDVSAAPTEAPPTAPSGTPQPMPTFRRGEFTFNRRFFETKFAGFLRPVLGELEKNSVLYIKSMRGEYIGRRITNLTQNEVVLQIFKADVTADESIPYSEISEVQIRPQDAA